MKKFLSVLAVICIVLSCTLMGIGTVAFAAQESPEEDFLVYDGVLEEYIGDGGDVVIPASLGIKEIAANAFDGSSDIVTLTIPEGVTKIGMYAFRHCDSLEQATLPYSLTEMDACFMQCSNLTSITVPGNLAEIAYGAFSSCASLTEVVISYGVEEIHTLAFQGTMLSEVIIPETVDKIYSGAFSNIRVNDLTITICNPDCDLDLVENLKGEIVQNIDPILAYNLSHKTTFIVPRGSAVGKYIEDYQKRNYGKAWTQWDGTTYTFHETFTVREKDQEYFDELPENQKGYGTQKPTSTTNGNGNGDNTSPGTQVGNSQQANNNNQNTNGNGTVITTTDNSSGNLIIIVVCVFGGIMLIVIVVVVILAATGKLFGGKNRNDELELLKAQMAQMQASKAAEADTEAKADDKDENNGDSTDSE